MALSETLDPFEEDGEESPVVANDAEADLLLRRLARLDREADRIREVVAKEQAHLAVWRENRLNGIDAKREWLWRSLEGWTRVACTERRVRSIALPAGRLGLRAGRKRVETWQDAEAIGREHPDLVRTETTVLRSAVGRACRVGPVVGDPETCEGVDIPDGYHLHHAVNDHGEVVEGVGYLVPAEDVFYATVSRD